MRVTHVRGHRTLEVAPQLDQSHLEAFQRKNLDALVLDDDTGFIGTDLGALPAFAERLKHLYVFVPSIDSLEPVASLTELETLVLAHAARRRNPDLSGLQKLRTLEVEHGKGMTGHFSSPRLEVARISRSPFVDLSPLAGARALSQLTLGEASRLETLTGPQLPNLLELQVHGAPKLRTLEPLPTVFPNLRVLELVACRHIDSIAPLTHLPSLKKVVLEDCGPVASLRPLERLQLTDVIFSGTTEVVDGDLGFLMKMRSLRNVSLADRAHYSHTRRELQRSTNPLRRMWHK